MTPQMSSDCHAYEWLDDFAKRQGAAITSIGRRWLSRAISHLEERVEEQLRAKG